MFLMAREVHRLQEIYKTTDNELEKLRCKAIVKDIIAPSIEEITIITREYGSIVSTCIGKSFGRAVGMCHIDLSVVRTQHA